MVRVTNGIEKLSQGNFLILVSDVCQKMTGNLNFPDQQAAIKDLAEAKDLFVKLVSVAKNGTRLSIMQRNALRKEIELSYTSLGASVSAVAKGDILLLETSGFPFTQPRVPTPPLVVAQAPRLSLGTNPGEILCKLFTQKGMLAFNLFVCTDMSNEANWILVPAAQASTIVAGLTAGVRHYFRYQLKGVRKQVVMSEISSFIPQ